MALIKVSKNINNDPDTLKAINATFETFELIEESKAETSSHAIYRLKGKRPNIPFDNIPDDDTFINLEITRTLSGRLFVNKWTLADQITGV